MNRCEKCGLRARYDKNPDRFWAEYGSGISGGVQDGSLISGPCRMKNERNCQSNIDSAKTKRDIDIPHLIDYIR